MGLRSFAQIRIQEILRLATAHHLTRKPPVRIPLSLCLRGHDQHLQAVEARNAHRRLGMTLHPPMRTLHRGTRRQHDHLLVFARHLRLRIVEQALHRRMLEKPGISHPHPFQHFFPALLIAHDRTPGRQADRARVWRIRQRLPQILLLPCRVG